MVQVVLMMTYYEASTSMDLSNRICFFLLLIEKKEEVIV
jgi:hypothetical protein